MFNQNNYSSQLLKVTVLTIFNYKLARRIKYDSQRFRKNKCTLTMYGASAV